MPRNKRPCAVCGTMLERAIPHGDWKDCQPHDGGEIKLIFCYGSTKFDMALEGTVFRGLICDGCAERIIPNLFLDTQTDYPFHGDRRAFNRTLPKKFTKHLAGARRAKENKV